MAKPKQYEVYDKITGKLLAVGTARYCSEVLDVDCDTIRAIARGANSYKFVVEAQEQDGPDKVFEGNTSLREAANAWDKFREPICRKYGIPTRRMESK